MEVLLLAPTELFLHVFLCYPPNWQRNTIITCVYTVKDWQQDENRDDEVKVVTA